MPTKSGLMKLKDFRQGVTAWEVKVYVNGDGTTLTYKPARRRFVGKATPLTVDYTNADGLTPMFRYNSYLIEWHLNYTRSYVEPQYELLDEYGYSFDSKTPYMGLSRIFKTYKAALRYYHCEKGFPHKENVMNVQQAEYASALLAGRSPPEFKTLDIFDRLDLKPIILVRNKERYRRIPGKKLRDNIMHNGVVVKTERCKPFSAATRARFKALFDTMTSRGQLTGKASSFEKHSRGALPHLPKEPKQTRKVRKAAQRKGIVYAESII